MKSSCRSYTVRFKSAIVFPPHPASCNYPIPWNRLLCALLLLLLDCKIARGKKTVSCQVSWVYDRDAGLKISYSKVPQTHFCEKQIHSQVLGQKNPVTPNLIRKIFYRGLATNLIVGLHSQVVWFQQLKTSHIAFNDKKGKWMNKNKCLCKLN